MILLRRWSQRGELCGRERGRERSWANAHRFATREGDQIGHPGPTEHQRRDPLHGHHPGPRRVGRSQADRRRSSLQLQPRARPLLRPPERLGDPSDVAPNVRQPGGLQADDSNGRPVGELGDREAGIAPLHDRLAAPRVDAGRTLELAAGCPARGKRVVGHAVRIDEGQGGTGSISAGRPGCGP